MTNSMPREKSDAGNPQVWYNGWNRMSARVLMGFMVLGGFSVAAADDFRIALSPTNAIVKDLRQSTCRPNLGYCGGGFGGSCFGDDALAFAKHPDVTARLYRGAGVRLIRTCGLYPAWRGIAKYGSNGCDRVTAPDGSCKWLHPKYFMDFCKRQNIKLLFCGSPSGERFGQCLEWIVKGGWGDVIAGIEMENEPFFGDDPAGYAAKWKTTLPVIRRVMPKVPIGLPLAEYCAGDPDLKAVRARLLGEKKLGDAFFHENRQNQWSAKTVVALGDDLKYVTHIVYHVYGGDSMYGCSQYGFERFRKFAKLFPQVADKRWWITEWRERSDEDLQCQRTFKSVLWKGLYIQTALCQPELDGFTIHELGGLAGGLYVSARGKWNQYQDNWENGIDVGAIAPDDYRGEVGATGALFDLYTQALLTHPYVLKTFAMDHHTQTGTFWASAQYYSNGKDDCQWTALWSAHHNSLCLLICNTTDRELKPEVTLDGYRLTTRTYRYVTCEKRFLGAYEVCGEPKPWKRVAWEEKRPDRMDASNAIVIPPHSVGTVMIACRKESERWLQHERKRLGIGKTGSRP